MMNLQVCFTANTKDASDINELLETLRYYSSKCAHVTELGTRTGISTSAFLFGQKNPEQSLFFAYDIQENPEALLVFEYAKRDGKRFEYIIQDDLAPGFEIQPTEFLFIDTLHTYKQLSQELERHANNVSKMIAFHDTVSFGDHDEVIAGITDNPQHPQYNDSEKHGLMTAINEFMEKNPQREILEDHKNNNGLLLLKNKDYDNTRTYTPKSLSMETINANGTLTETDKLNMAALTESLDDPLE